MSRKFPDRGQIGSVSPDQRLFRRERRWFPWPRHVLVELHAGDEIDANDELVMQPAPQS